MPTKTMTLLERADALSQLRHKLAFNMNDEDHRVLREEEEFCRELHRLVGG